jgi:3-oxoacyl-[acyl-carrier-protein] synthase II
VTGLGAVSAWGWGVEPLARGLRLGATAIRPFTRFDHSRQRTHVAGEVPARAEGAAPPAAAAARRSWADRFAVAAALEAVRQAGLPVPLSDPAVGVYFASSTGGLYESELYLESRWRGERASRGLFASQQLNGPGDAVARALQVTGGVRTVSSACASAALALEAALRDLRDGAVAVALAGGADSLCQVTYSGFNALRAVDERPCRPFRQDRGGMSLGVGAAVLVLETEAHALRRGGRPLAEFSGAGSSCDASHMTAPQPEGEGAALAVTRALRDAGIGPEAVAFVNAHGTGTPLNDAAEQRALQRVFAERAPRLPLTATKASVGHLLGAAGALEALATVLCVHSGELDPTAGEGDLDPDLPVDLVRGVPRPLAGGAGLSTNLAFGGANVALVFERWTA